MNNFIVRQLKKLIGNGFLLNKAPGSFFAKGKGVKIADTHIVLTGTSELIIDDNVKLEGYDIFLNDGYLKIENNSQLIKGRQHLNPMININKGKLTIGANNVIKADIKIRFGGNCTIGTYNSINEETEIRCDQSVTIGDYNMISYECMIYDTNTHCIYPSAERRERSKAEYPCMGSETEKPLTRQVIIGSDNWLGKRSVILKGCVLGNQVVVGTNAVASNMHIDSGLIVGNPAHLVHA